MLQIIDDGVEPLILSALKDVEVDSFFCVLFVCSYPLPIQCLQINHNSANTLSILLRLAGFNLELSASTLQTLE